MSLRLFPLLAHIMGGKYDVAAVLANFSGCALSSLASASDQRISTVSESLLLQRPRLEKRTINKIRKLEDEYKTL